MAPRETLLIEPDDGSGPTPLKRIGRFREDAPADWNGIWRMTEK